MKRSSFQLAAKPEEFLDCSSVSASISVVGPGNEKRVASVGSEVRRDLAGLRALKCGLTGNQHNQLRELRPWGKSAGHEVVEVFADAGISGSKGREKRSGFVSVRKNTTPSSDLQASPEEVAIGFVCATCLPGLLRRGELKHHESTRVVSCCFVVIIIRRRVAHYPFDQMSRCH